MPWNWQQPDWPNFTWNAATLAPAELAFQHQTGIFLGTVKHITPENREHLTIESLSTEALTTSEIEGEILDRASVQSSVRRQLGLSTDDDRRAKPAERGIAQMMVDVHLRFADPLSQQTLFDWQHMLLDARQDLADIGQYRRSPEPMQIISGPIHAPKVHFEAPPSFAMPGEMKSFLDWFSRTAPTGSEPLPSLTRAGIAHLYFVSIHPFEDGNGRIARALSEKSLAQTLGQPTLLALAATILARRKAYYDALAQASHCNEITPWLSWFAATAIAAQHRSIALVEFVIEKTRFLDQLRESLNPRQEKALLRMLREGPDGFKGGLSAANYATITGASPATTTRDLADLVAKGALLRTGEYRHARYAIPIASSALGPDEKQDRAG